MSFTEARAKEKLEELGFEVIDTRDYRFFGYSIEQFQGHWVVFELSVREEDGDKLRANLSGHKESFIEALSWLTQRVKEGRA